MLLAALGLADVVALVAAGDADFGPLLAHVVWEGEGVFGHVWLESVGAFAAVGELLCVARVLVGGHGVLLILHAEKWAGGGLIGTPDVLDWERNGLWVNPVDAVGLSLDRDGEGKGGSAGKLESVHIDGIDVQKANVRTDKDAKE